MAQCSPELFPQVSLVPVKPDTWNHEGKSPCMGLVPPNPGVVFLFTSMWLSSAAMFPPWSLSLGSHSFSHALGPLEGLELYLGLITGSHYHLLLSSSGDLAVTKCAIWDPHKCIDFLNKKYVPLNFCCLRFCYYLISLLT